MWFIDEIIYNRKIKSYMKKANKEQEAKQEAKQEAINAREQEIADALSQLSEQELKKMVADALAKNNALSVAASKTVSRELEFKALSTDEMYTFLDIKNPNTQHRDMTLIELIDVMPDYHKGIHPQFLLLNLMFKRYKRQKSRKAKRMIYKYSFRKQQRDIKAIPGKIAEMKKLYKSRI